MLLQLGTTLICLNWQFDNVCYKLAHVAKVKDYESTPGQQSAAVSMLLLLRSSTRPCWTAGPASLWCPHTLVVRKPSLVQDDGSTGTSIDCDNAPCDLVVYWTICTILVLASQWAPIPHYLLSFPSAEDRVCGLESVIETMVTKNCGSIRLQIGFSVT